MYYATRIADDRHWGRNLSGLKYDAWYLDVWRDAKYVASNAGVTFFRGPMCSGQVSIAQRHGTVRDRPVGAHVLCYAMGR